MRREWVLSLCVLFGILQGCVNFLYQGEITAPDSDGHERRIVLYWPKTSTFLWGAKAGPATLLTQCGERVTFVEQPEGIVFRGIPGEDRLASQEEGGTVSEGQTCGRFVGVKRFTDIEAGALSLTIACEPIATEFSVGNKAYLGASPDPYEFQITEQKTWSLLGSPLAAPEPPSCPHAP